MQLLGHYWRKDLKALVRKENYIIELWKHQVNSICLPSFFFKLMHHQKKKNQLTGPLKLISSFWSRFNRFSFIFSCLCNSSLNSISSPCISATWKINKYINIFKERTFLHASSSHEILDLLKLKAFADKEQVVQITKIVYDKVQNIVSP